MQTNDISFENNGKSTFKKSLRPTMITLINPKYLSIFLSENFKSDHKIPNSNHFAHQQPSKQSDDQKSQNSNKVSSATLPKPSNNPGIKRKVTLDKEYLSFEKGLFNKYIHPLKKIEVKTPKFKRKTSIQQLQVKDEQPIDEVPPENNSPIRMIGSPCESQTSFQAESQENINSNNTICEFSLEDYKFLQGIIKDERKTLEVEIQETTAKSISRIGISTKHQKHWQKLRKTLSAISRMQHFTNEIKNFGTSFGLSGLKLVNPIFEAKLLQYSKAQNWILMPGDKSLVFWELLLLLSMVYSICFTPLRCVFYDDLSNNPSLEAFETFMMVFFCLDMVVSMNTAYLENQKPVLDRWRIFLKYVKFWFWIDLISVFWIENNIMYTPDPKSEQLTFLVNFLFTSHLHELLRIFRLRKINIVHKFMIKLQDLFKIKSPYMKLLTFFLTTLMCLHLVSCLWYFIAKIKQFSPDTWVSDKGLDTTEDFTLYLASFYWATATLSTVGYGDIHANNELEYFFSIIWLVLGAGFYSYTIGSISNVITNAETKRSTLLHKKIIMESFMKDHKFPKSLKYRIKKALEYHSAKSVFSHSDKQEILNEIPVELRFEIATSQISNIKTRIPFFSNKDKVFIAYFIPLLTPYSISIGEFLFREGEYPTLFYILVNGRVNYVTGPYKLAFKTLIEGSYFGEIEIFNNTGRIADLQAVSHLDLLILSRKEFEEVMKTFPEIEVEMRKVAFERIKRLRECQHNVKSLLRIPKNSNFWTNKPKSNYQMFVENKRMNFRRSSTPLIKRKSSLRVFNGYFSALLNKKSLGSNSASPTSKFSAALKRLSVFSGKNNNGSLNSISNLDKDLLSSPKGREKTMFAMNKPQRTFEIKPQTLISGKESPTSLDVLGEKIESSGDLTEKNEFFPKPAQKIKEIKENSPKITHNSASKQKIEEEKKENICFVKEKNTILAKKEQKMKVFERSRNEELGRMRRNLLNLEIDNHEKTRNDKKTPQNMKELVKRDEEMLIKFEEKVKELGKMATQMQKMASLLKKKRIKQML